MSVSCPRHTIARLTVRLGTRSRFRARLLRQANDNFNAGPWQGYRLDVTLRIVTGCCAAAGGEA
jgi:hypothetical protein